MKKFFAIIIFLIIALSFSGCTKTKINSGAQATLKFIYADKDIVQVLETEEVSKIKEIFNNKNLHTKIPACGFDENISIIFNEQIFAVACDDCAVVMDYNNKKYFNISDADKEYVVSVFEKYGGYFPCL